MVSAPLHEPVGVIDIGSNSVRLVIFDGLKRHAVPIFNEKMLCGLGENLASTGRLPEDGKAEAARCFARYVRVARELPVISLRVIATAAIRDAGDGPAFMRELSEAHHLPIEILPGDEEARLAALGVRSTIHAPHGIAGDLGGGSLELIAMMTEKEARISLPLGVLRLWSESGGDAAAIRRQIDHGFDRIDWLRPGDFPAFYAIGGSFRMLARIHMRRVDYPLRLLHEYRLERRELRKFTEDMLRLSPHALASLKGMPAERAHMMIPGLLVLERILDRVGCDEVVFCTGGIREGLLFDQLPPDEQRQDPLLAYALEHLGDTRAASYAGALRDWLLPLLERAPNTPARLVEAFCYLSETALAMHPECRAQWAYDSVLYSPCTGITHAERVWLALAMYHRHRAKLRFDAPRLRLLDDAQKTSARLFGVAASLAHMLSGGATTLLQTVSLLPGDERIMLNAAGELLATDTATLEKLLEALEECVKALDSRAR